MLKKLLAVLLAWFPIAHAPNGEADWTDGQQIVRCPANVAPPSAKCIVVFEPPPAPQE